MHFSNIFVCLLLATAVSAASRTCYGNIDNLHPTGQANGGTSASDADAQHDKPYLDQHKTCYDQSANKHCIQASVIAAIASRESRGGLLLKNSGGYGDNGHAWGIMQVSIKHPSWSKEQKLQGGVAAYNFGVKNVVTWSHLDIGSTHNDYSNDVIARAKYLRLHGYN